MYPPHVECFHELFTSFTTHKFPSIDYIAGDLSRNTECKKVYFILPMNLTITWAIWSAQAMLALCFLQFALSFESHLLSVIIPIRQVF
jgi:hypothetical protein